MTGSTRPRSPLFRARGAMPLALVVLLIISAAGAAAPEVGRRPLTEGSEIGGGPPEVLAACIRDEIAKWTRIPSGW